MSPITDSVAVVFAGGQGTRIWPVSRDGRPKQFQPISGDAPLLTHTIERLQKHMPAERIFVSTLTRYRDVALECSPRVPETNFIFEEEGKGPSTALALALARIVQVHGNVRVFTCPSDHLIDDDAEFITAIGDMLDALDQRPGAPVILGVKPRRPDTSLGYVETRSTAGSPVLETVSIVEKPSADVARQLLAADNYYWNTACYALRPQDVLSTYRTVHPSVMDAIEQYAAADQSLGYSGPSIPDHEMDPFFAVGARPLLVARDFGWSDVGTWPRLAEWLNSQVTTSTGSAVNCDASGVLVVSLDGRPVVALGADNLIVVTHQDAVYVIDRDRADDAGTLDHLRSLLAETPREDLL